ncbi:MAG: GNAT family N-acetyltransferase [Nitrospirae bacterium]|nr:GNAT family N-acetyltransferase [Nitrospirota bacterium]MCL5977687.1 GNAT family N-acetyltransferase [Nitrospirota bacterium]
MIEQFTFRRLGFDSEIKPFDCGDSDLNEFFYKDALNYLRQFLAVTYVFENKLATVAFFSVLNDRISGEDSEKSIFRKIRSKIPHKKHFRSFPAVKVGRFGVDQQFHSQRIGTEVMDFIKAFFTIRNKTGCRFITVDAYNYPRTINFYKKNGFDFLTSHDGKEDTRSMYFDLMTFARNNSAC